MKSYFALLPAAAIQAIEDGDVSCPIHVSDARYATMLAARGGDADAAFADYMAASRQTVDDVAELAIKYNNLRVEDGEIASAMSVVDFAAEYGFLTRFLKPKFATGRVFAVELDEPASYFGTIDLKIDNAFVGHRPGAIEPFWKFNLVVAHELLTRVSPELFGPWLAKFAAFGAPGALVYFTARGPHALAWRFPGEKLDGEGFYFRPPPVAAGRRARGYGETFVAPRTVFAMIDQFKGARLLHFSEAAGHEGLDAYLLRLSDA